MGYTGKCVWRFGYGSNIGLQVLQQKKNLNPQKYLTGTIKGWELYFTPGIDHVEPGWAAVRQKYNDDSNVPVELHGSAFYIPEEEAQGLDQQERGYNVLPCQFVSYGGEIIEEVGLYVPKKKLPENSPEGIPSLRYLRLLQKGAGEGNLAKHWIQRLDSFQHYVTPPDVRSQTLMWISGFHDDPDRKDVVWTAEYLTKYNGSDLSFPAHTSVMGYIVRHAPDAWAFSSWKGHSITRRNLLQFNGKSVDANDIRFGEPGFHPLPNLKNCDEEEKEFVMQNLECLLHRGGVIVARLKDFLDAQED